jgi:hypothetical protein
VTAKEADNEPCPNPVYVDGSAAGANDGTSWSNAYKHLQDALGFAEQTGGHVSQIWIAAGIYRPDENTAYPQGSGNTSATFRLLGGVSIFGGFPAGGSDWSGRNDQVYKTYLDGNLDDTSADPRSNHVVSGLWIDSTAVLDGVTVRYGKSTYYGGGIYLIDSNVLLNRCQIVSNTADLYGGGLYNKGGNLTCQECTFSSNGYYPLKGGGVFNIWGHCLYQKCYFIGNQCHGQVMQAPQWSTGYIIIPCYGGGLFSWGGYVDIIECLFKSNTSQGVSWTYGGGDAYGGGLSLEGGHVNVKNCTIFLNKASGGIPDDFEFGIGTGWGGAYIMQAAMS